MTFPIHLLAIAALLVPSSALAAGAFSNHPEEAYPDNMPTMASPGPYGDFIKQVQAKLHAQGFDAGPINGDFGTKTQAALVQYQLSQDLPASGQLDDRTLQELGVPRDKQASAADESAQEDESLGGTCDDLIGPEKEACLHQGGTVEAGMQPDNRAAAAATAK